MSETDSENDYESADEAEHLSKVALNVRETLEEQKTLLDNKLPLSENLNEGREVTSFQESTIEEIPSSSLVPEANSTVANPDSVPHVELNAISKSDKVQALSHSDSENSARRSSSSDGQPKRVTLRLEKKLQQKNQAAANSTTVTNEEQKLQEKTSSWGFGSWGTSLLSSAASSVSTFTSQVSQGIGTVLETVETSLGAPPPEDLASMLKERRESDLNSEKNMEANAPNETVDESEDEGISSTSSLFTGVTSLTRVIESTGSKVLMGGLDTLELIGKKTMDILTEGDPGLRRKRSAFSKGVNLSQLLREARDKAEEQQTNTSLENQEDSVHFSTFFDEFQGLVHLEALEMLSNQCQNKVEGALMMFTGDSNVKESLEHVKRICEDLPSADETPDDKIQDFEESVLEHLNALQLPIDMQRIKMVRNSIHEWLDKCHAEQEAGQVKDAKELYRQAISSLAEFTARCVEQFHKFGELILVQTDPDFNTLLCATHLTGLTSVLCVEVSIMATKYCQCLNTAADVSEDPDAVTPLITTIFLEASNSTTYIQDAFQLLVPVLQTALLQ